MFLTFGRNIFWQHFQSSLPSLPSLLLASWLLGAALLDFFDFFASADVESCVVVIQESDDE